MTLRSPIVAMLWELWRLTRAEIAWKLALPIGAALAALALGAAFGPRGNPKEYQNINDGLAALALILIVIPHLIAWVSMAKLNGGLPGFPLYLSYTRPVRTAVIVGLPMAYLTTMSSAMYLVSAMVLRVTSGYAFPLLPVAAWIAALTLVFVATGWSTRNRALQAMVGMVATLRALGLAVDRLTAVEIPGGYDWPPRLWSTLFDWPLTDYAWIALIGLVSFAVTVVMVTRQRRGDEGLPGIKWIPGGLSRADSRGGLWDRLVSLFRLSCPTSSATRAQLWFHLRSNGLPVLTIGVALALMIVLVSAVSVPIDAVWNADPDVPCPIQECFWARAIPPISTPLSLLIVLGLGGNAFGIRRRQGRAYLSAFDATQASSTAHLAVLKLLVQSACVLIALVAIGVSAWMSLTLLGDGVFIQMSGVPLSSRRSVITAAFAALTGYEQLALAVVAAVAVAAWVASWAALGALRTHYRRRINLAVCVLLLYGVVFAWLAVRVGVDPETASQFHLDIVFGAMRWIATAAMVFTTVFVFWSGFAEHVLTIRYASGAVAISAAFGAAWLTALHVGGVQLAGMSAMNALSVVSPALLPLTVSVLAPWSYSRIRHT
jgi:hypothetical protein